MLAGCGGSAEFGSAGPPSLDAAPPAAGGSLDPAQFGAAVVQMARSSMAQDAASPNTDPAKMLASHAAEWTKVAQLAPAEIRPDTERIAGAMQQAAGSGDPAAIMAEVQEPMQRYIQYGAQHCPKPTG